MASLPREVHEVLEQEYVSMYGPLDRVDVKYAKDDIVDVQWALAILRACELAADDRTKNAIASKTLDEAREQLAERLNQLVSNLPADVARSNALTDKGRDMLTRYDALRDGAGPSGAAELHRRILDEVFSGAVVPLHERRLANVYRALHKRANASSDKARTALCISGGGIRSATFALGVVQGLASAKILDRFDYLSTVSGGGYIGSWLSSWTRRHPHGISGVQEDLARSDTAVGESREQAQTGSRSRKPEERTEKLEPEPKPVRHLREYSNYLSPRLGLMSGDAWTMVALYVRNVVLNLLILVPIIALVLAIPRLFSLLLRTTYEVDGRVHLSVAVIAIGFAFAYIGRRRPIENERFENAAKKEKYLNSTDSQFIRRCVVPLTIAAVMISLFWAEAAQHGSGILDEVSTWILGGAAVLAMTVVPYVFHYSRYRRTYRESTLGDPAEDKKRLSILRRRQVWESIGTILGLATAAIVLTVLATKVFNNPLQVPDELIDALRTAPAERAGISLTPWGAIYACLSVPAVLLVFFLQATIFVGISSHYAEDYDREWWGRAGAWLLIIAAGWVVLSAITFFGPPALYHAPILLASVGGLSGIAAALLGFSAKTPANKKEKENSGAAATAGNAALGLAVPVFVVFFLSLIALGTTWMTQQFPSKAPLTDFKAQSLLLDQTLGSKLEGERQLGQLQLKFESASVPAVSIPALRTYEHLRTVYNTAWDEMVILGLIALGAWVLSMCIGVNKFSMHALYRNRLIRAYLGASRYTRSPNPFTGFDPNDDLRMYRLRPELLWPTNLYRPDRFFKVLAAEGKRTTQTDLSDYKLGRRKLAQELWSRFSPKAKEYLDAPVSGGSIDAVVANINAILLDETNPLEDSVEKELPDDFWAPSPAKAKAVPYPASIRNRAVLDYYYCDVLAPMPRPKDVSDDQEKGVTIERETVFTETGKGARRRAPLHIVNMALNLVGGEKLAWQQRMAETFTVSPYDAGNLFLGYRDARRYGGRDGISLGTAVTISGAAASPNMGYHSSPALAFLLTLFNIRLGWWLGNPGVVGDDAYDKEHPSTNLGPIFSEASGKTNDRYPWVYLSDGGHFENLALYEMVLRRCHYIVLSDAGADPKFAFDDLGNAIRKIRTDLGVPIDIEEMFMLPRPVDGVLADGRYIATATIRYSAVDGPDAKEGLLIYLKPGCYKDEYFPRDVFNYAAASPDFPHESTADQFFSESQFESYRALGRHAIAEICCNYPDRSAPRPRIPVTKEFRNVGEFAHFVEEKAKGRSAPPEVVIAEAIRELKRVTPA
jgi:Patatin-like phospholipase